MNLRLVETLPALAEELATLLVAAGQFDLARQVPELMIVDRCGCEDDFCASFYTQPKPNGAYAAAHDCLDLRADRGAIILDVVQGQVMFVEVLSREDIRRKLRAAIP
ncbi:MAG TPA: hypothetical protein VMI10_11515 [Terriglobales bacterium]|nr:hypothetical protein [Terriglobales bacterium]